MRSALPSLRCKSEFMKKLRVAVIGTGYLGQFHAEKYARMNDVELVGVVDVDKSRADAVAEKGKDKGVYKP